MKEKFKGIIDKFTDYLKKEGSVKKILIVAGVVFAAAAVVLFLTVGRKDKAEKIDEIKLPAPTDVVSNSEISIETQNENKVDFDTLLPERKYSKEDKEVDIPIESDYFVAGIFELRGNYKKNGYLGKTISIEGRYSEFMPEGSNVVYHNVSRLAVSEDLGEQAEKNAQDCGIEFVWNGEYPKEGDWIKVVGVLRAYKEGDQEFLTIDALLVDVLDTPGSLYVYY